MKVYLVSFLAVSLIHSIILLPLGNVSNSSPTAKLKKGKISIFIKKNKIRPKKISKVIQQEKSKITKKIVSESNSKVAHLKTKINPKYPYLSRVYKEEGKGSYQVFLNEDGSVKEVKTISTSGYKRLDKAALNWLRRAEFKIPKNSTNREVIQEIVFELK